MIKFSQFLNKVGALAIACLVTILFISVGVNRVSAIQADIDINKKSVTESQNYDLDKILKLEKKEKETAAEEKTVKKEISPKTKPTTQEAKFSFSYAMHQDDTYILGLGISCLGIDLAYNTYVAWYGEQVLKEFSACILYKLPEFKELSMKMGFRSFSFNYDKEDFFSRLGKGFKDYENGTLWGADLEFLGNTSITKRIGLFGEIGAVLLVNKEFLPQIGSGLILKIVSRLALQIGYYRIGLNSADRLSFDKIESKIELTFR